MRLKISHRTEYRYGAPTAYGLQRLRLTPTTGPTQTVESWSLAIEGAREEIAFVDQFDNETRLISLEGGSATVAVVAEGIVETRDTVGMGGHHAGFAPLWLYGRMTPLTEPGAALREFAGAIKQGDQIGSLHNLMNAVADTVDYIAGATSAATTAEQALTARSGVCQDHAHIFIAAARLLGYPARYVSGYLMMDATKEQAASHAWAEAHVRGLGWVAFDASNRISPDERYVRLAIGRDYRDATPVSGIRLGQGAEALAVTITVEQ